MQRNSSTLEQNTEHVRPTTLHWPSVWQFGLSLMAAIALWGTALTIAMSGMVQRFLYSTASRDSLALLLMAAGIFFTGLLLLPSIGYALARLSGRSPRKVPPIPRIFAPRNLILVLPVVLLLGYWVSGYDELSWLLLPVLHILAVGVPVLWLVYIGLRYLPLGSLQRRWGVFGSGMVLAPALIMGAELAVVFTFVVIGVFVIASKPDLMSEITWLAQRLETLQTSPEAVGRILEPYLVSPAVLFTVFALGVVFVPLIEELIKPIGVWLIVGYPLSPAEGFVAGVLSGAGFALFESLALASSVDGWAALVIARIGTGVIHIVTTGMVGWALALAWGTGSYFRLGATYLVAVLVHGLWNGLTLFIIFATLPQIQSRLYNPELLSGIGGIAPYGLVVLAASAFLALWWANVNLRRDQKNERTIEE